MTVLIIRNQVDTGAWLLFIIMKRLEMVSLNSDCFCLTKKMKR
nr:MAG TPA: hypothetical protein [Caudoviricetes sp.]